MEKNKIKKPRFINEDKMLWNGEPKSTDRRYEYFGLPGVWETPEIGSFSAIRIELMLLLKFWMKKVVIIHPQCRTDNPPEEFGPCSIFLAVKRIEALVNRGMFNEEVESVIQEVNRELGVNLDLEWWFNYLYNDDSPDWIDAIVENHQKGKPDPPVNALA